MTNQPEIIITIKSALNITGLTIKKKIFLFKYWISATSSVEEGSL